MYQRHPDWPVAERLHAMTVLKDVLQELGDFAATESICRELLQHARNKVPPDVSGNRPDEAAKWKQKVAEFEETEKK